MSSRGGRGRLEGRPETPSLGRLFPRVPKNYGLFALTGEGEVKRQGWGLGLGEPLWQGHPASSLPLPRLPELGPRVCTLGGIGALRGEGVWAGLAGQLGEG